MGVKLDMGTEDVGNTNASKRSKWASGLLAEEPPQEGAELEVGMDDPIIITNKETGNPQAKKVNRRMRKKGRWDAPVIQAKGRGSGKDLDKVENDEAAIMEMKQTRQAATTTRS